MRVAAFCCIGIEDVLSSDIKEIIGKTAKILKGCCIFDADEAETVKLTYLCQSLENIGVLLQDGKIEDDPTSIDITKIEFKIKDIFSVECEVIGDKPFKSIDIITDLSEKIKEKTKKIFTYREADIKYLVKIIDEKYYLCIGLSNKDLVKRDYKVFVNKGSLRGSISYALSKIAKATPKEKILDCFCRSGEIPIELTHHFSGKSLHFYSKEKFLFVKLGWNIDLAKLDNIKEDKYEIYLTDSNMANLRAAEKNAKIAGINKLMNYSRTNIEDLDLRFDSDVDKIITQLPSKTNENENTIEKLYRQFFVILPKVVKKTAELILIGRNIELTKKYAEEFGYKMIHNRIIMQGKEELTLYIYQK